MTFETLYTYAGAWIRQQTEQMQIPLDDPDSLHDQRVASRRLRMACAVFPEALGGKRLLKDLKGLTKLLGEARQWDVQEALLARMRGTSTDIQEQAALEYLQDRAQEHRKASWKVVRATPPPKELFKALESFADRVEARDDLARVPILAWNALLPLLQEAFGPLEELYESENAERMHQVRGAFKQFRYGTEILQPAFMSGQEDFLARAREFQTSLGDHHDQVVLQGFLEDERERLAKRGRVTLRGGLEKALAKVAMEREALYQAFRIKGLRISVDEISQTLWLSLGPIPTQSLALLPDGEEPAGPAS